VLRCAQTINPGRKGRGSRTMPRRERLPIRAVANSDLRARLQISGGTGHDSDACEASREKQRLLKTSPYHPDALARDSYPSVARIDVPYDINFVNLDGGAISRSEQRNGHALRPRGATRTTG